jgi:hypothetical protein
MKTVPTAVRMSLVGLTLALLALGMQWSGPRLLPHSADAQTRPPTVAADMPMYKPPLRGAPGNRVGGGTRGHEGLPTLSVLAPDHTGFTIHEQPALYWYLSGETKAPVEVTLTVPRSPQPLFETRLSPPLQPGVQRVRLADYGVRLESGVSYQWSVALVPDPAQRSQDVTASGRIERTALSDELRAQLTQTSKARLPHLYAEAGLWYDAIAAISDLIDATPQDTTLRQQRAALLEQVDLPQVVTYDRQAR